MSSQHILAVRPVRITKDKRVEYPSTEELIDLFKRLTTVPAEYQGLLFIIDFTRPYDSEYMKQFVSPVEAYQGLVDYEAEGLPQPYAAGAKQVAKIKVEPGQTIYLIFPLQVVHSYIVVSRATLYVPSGVKFNHYYVLGGVLTDTRMEFPKDFEGVDDWAKLVNTWFAEQHNGSVAYVIRIRNDTSETKYVYLAHVMAQLNRPDDVTEKFRRLYMTKNGKVVLSNEEITFRIIIEYVFPVKHENVRYICDAVIAGDGTNALTFSVVINNVEVFSVSRTDTAAAWYACDFYTKLRKIAFAIDLKFSTPGTGTITEVAFSACCVPPQARYTKRTSGSYTSDGDGTADTVTILDYTEATKHISRLMRVKATGDSNTKQLVLRVDGNDVWDFLNDGDTCTLELRDIKKVELVVNDPGGGTTTTVNYVIQFEEENAHLVK